MKTQTMVGYYRDHKFNPVPIALSDQPSWKSHVSKRLNLYQRHLGIPLNLLEGHAVLEFGCNSGENALVLAAHGARMTLVEPNEQVLPRLKDNFKRYELENQIDELINIGIQEFQTEKRFSLVIAEGFLYTLKNRNEVFLNISQFIRPGGLGVVSFNDPYGNLIELTKRLIARRVGELKGIKDIHSAESLDVSRTLFEDDFKKLNASRPFAAWWKDMIVSPFFSLEYLWTYEELLKLLDQAGCQFLSCSPKWDDVNCHNWYKNVPDSKSFHKSVFENWRRELPFILTGLKNLPKTKAASMNVVRSLERLANQISEYTKDPKKIDVNQVIYSKELDRYFQSVKDHRVKQFNVEMKTLFSKLKSKNFDEIIRFYKKTKFVRHLWGTSYHYMSFSKV